MNFYLALFIFEVFYLSTNGQESAYIPKHIRDKYGLTDNQSGVKTTGVKTTGVKTTGTKTVGVKTESHGSYVDGDGSSFGSKPSGYKGGCTSAPPPPMNAAMKCSQYSGCRANCISNYQFPNGQLQLFITCKDGEWQVEGTEWETIPSCEPICSPPCLNNGICLAPNKCQCPENFAGPQCEFENKPCLNYPPMPINSRRSCSPTTCTITCLKKHKFPDGSEITTMICKDGSWVPSKSQWLQIPDCEATCTPSCQNGGKCIAVDVCRCPPEFRGPQCQYSATACQSSKLNFNGGYNCSSKGDLFRCSLACPEGIEFDFPPEPYYTCTYAEGIFKPQPLPKCVYDPDMIVIPLDEHSNTFYQQSNSSFSLNSMEVNGQKVPGSHGSHGSYYYTQNYPDQVVTSSYPNYHNDSHIMYIPVKGQYGVTDDKDVGVENKPKSGTCFTWSGNHYKTFDGQVFSFNSPCAHTLVQDAIDNTFSISVQNSKECSTDPEECYRIVRIYHQDKVYTLKRSPSGVPIFMKNKKILPIPGRVAGIRSEMSAHYVVILLDFVGAKIKWDGRQLVQVEVKESLWDRTTGLCGKLDGNPQNDLLTKAGVKPKSIVTLASSWQVDSLEDTCKDIPSEEEVCEDGIKGSKGQKATAFCKKLLSDKKFAACHEIMSISVLMDACRSDYCTCTKMNPKECACETLNMYVRECGHKGVTNLANWRDDKTCPVQCTGGRIYMACGPANGQAVCGGVSELGDDNVPCEEGCYCPEGTVLHNSQCILKSSCPCLYRGKEQPPGASIPKDCNTCTCMEGKWICTQISCSARCSALGDPHYITFDGKRYDFMGQCTYHLVKHDDFSISAENVACAGSISQAMNFPISISSELPSCTKTVIIDYKGQTIKLKQNHEVVVNGQEVTNIPFKIAGIEIRAVSSIFLFVELPNGIQIWWDGLTRAYVDAPAAFMGKTQGLCGTFNSNQKDDFLTPDGDIEHSPVAFANKWKTTEKCSDVPEKIKSHPCNINMQNKPTAEKYCKVIKSELFAECHWEVDPEPFYQDCTYDMCSCEAKMAKCLCPMIAAYAGECAQKGIKIDWRNEVRECGMHCASGQKYQICGNSCTRSCYHIATDSDCRPQCVEGCNCPEGQALDDNGECIPISECECQLNGLTFPSGYKEVRPASKAPELCTCLNAQWTCRPATPGEMIEYPKADDLRSMCKASENKEFTTCEPVEPVTCKNMHSPEMASAAVCHAGCECKKGYVLDTFSKVCVKPTDCPCHHGGRSYSENAVVQSDCNKCTCKHGKWDCTNDECPSECSAWGDSHYKTFDGKIYDYQGQCDYIFAKGIIENQHSFDISIQNVPCGSLGVSCSKSLTIKVGSFPNQEVVTLTRDKEIPEYKTLKQLIVRQKGHYVIVDAPELGLTVRWDKGTRVYVKLGTMWKNKVRGLCGNYNDNEMDDFQTPSGGLSEVSPQLFGDSWRLQPYCSNAVEITDTCESRPDRKVWALKKCDILKSSVFAGCHSEVPVETYLERCIFDACACDQGGDCECLCTALAAYAEECNNKGVAIKWRTPDLCPMQCDERCSNYEPCISTCFIETCDNTMDHGQISKGCEKETCIEGCQVKPCASDFIYLNSSLLECVPRNICKPLCLEIKGVAYYEGDLMEKDDCHSCYCSRGKKQCQGQPCSTTSMPVTPPQTESMKCVSGWTPWINQDKQPGVKGNKGKLTDKEPLPGPLLMNALKGSKCSIDNMIAIECRTVKGHISPKETGLDVECSLERGLICQSVKGGRLCPDFEIRVKCSCDPTPVVSTFLPCDLSDLSQMYREHPTDCQLFYQCAPGEHGAELVEKSCGPHTMYNPITKVCDFASSVIDIRPECLYSGLTTGRPITHEVAVEPPGTECSLGQVYKECGIKCAQMCHIYLKQIQKIEAQCLYDQECEDGCVSENLKTCPSGMFLQDESTCVRKQDCMCASHSGVPHRPGKVVNESPCEVCQCINNDYICDTSNCGEVLRNETTWEFGIPDLFHNISGGVVVAPSSVTPPSLCNEDDYGNLINGPFPLGDEVFSASSTLNRGFAPKYARLIPGSTKKLGNTWAPKTSDKDQYLQINLGRQEPIYGIIISGNPVYDEYVTSFTVLYTPDGHTFSYVTDRNRHPKIFRGTIEAGTPVRQMFDIPVEAQIIRINPQTWHNGIALKTELIGCADLGTTLPPTTLPTPTCIDPLGVDNSIMLNDQIAVSSELRPHHTKDQLKTSGRFAWQPITNSPSEWVQFDFIELRNITGFVSKGGPDGWVTAFNVKYSTNGRDWNPILNDDWKEQKFLGNFDENTAHVVAFSYPIQTRYLKVIPVKWHQNIQLRIEPHGCFLPYPTREYVVTEAPSSVCNSCPGVSSAELELGACRCKEEMWWDGENCVSRTQCPCLVGHIPYSVSTVFENEDCDQCVCKLGGIPQCTPKACTKCSEGLRSIVTSTCGCICQPCKEGTKLCLTSNICINETSWYNGVKDCPDDETNCEESFEAVLIPHLLITKPTVSELQNIVKGCPVPSCPPGYKVVFKKPTVLKPIKAGPSTMFSTYSSKGITNVKGGVKGSGVKGRKPSSLQKPPTSSEKEVEEKECQQFQCVSTRPPPSFPGFESAAQTECPPASCPIGYIPEFAVYNPIKKTDVCPQYECTVPPPLDSVCNVTGRTFNTFDKVEYKYDICNHILARDLKDFQWQVSLKKNCRKVCLYDLAINHDEHEFILHPDLSIEYDGYKYTVEQTKKISSRSNFFAITRLGDTLIFVSNKYGFWIIWDDQGNVKIGVSRKLLNKVDGLCGYFNDYPGDDKRKPNGAPAKTTADFGDSWAEVDRPAICEAKTCPLHIQNKAWEICNLVKEQTFAACAGVIDLDTFISSCLEITCTCLQSAGDDKEEQENCRCTSLQKFVVDCLSTNSDMDVIDWRMKYDCPAKCEAPLVHHDCYRRRCEPSCGALTDPDACPKLTHVCFPGCYCPPGYVRKKEKCVLPTSCGDCECNVLPHLEYITYDSKNFTINGNCTYVMARDVIGKKKDHRFQVLITNRPCQDKKEKTCVGKVTILYKGHKMDIVRDFINKKLKLTIDSDVVDDFSEIEKWVHIDVAPAKHFKIFLLKIQIQVSIYYPSLGVAVKAPSLKFARKLEGLCGDCNGDLSNDMKTPEGVVTPNVNDFGLSWLYQDLPGGQDREQCLNPPDEICSEVPIESDPCIQLEDLTKYGQCNPVLDPGMFINWCKKDTCNGHPELSCAAIEAYSNECGHLGFCIDWRTKICPAKECPLGQLYKPCAPACSQTCAALKEENPKCTNSPVEGCFCPDGKVFLNNTCVEEERCEACDDEGHRSGDKWEKDLCTTCTCEGTNVKCETQSCPNVETVCEQGYQAVKVPGHKQCCDKFICVPQPTQGTTCEPPQQLQCGTGQILKLIKNPQGCQQFVCECKPISECERVDSNLESKEPGIVKEVDKSGCCPVVIEKCKVDLCPKAPTCPSFHSTHKETITGKCCPKYECLRPKDKCIVDLQYTAGEKGGERPLNEYEKKQVLKDANDAWHDGPCRSCKCLVTPAGDYRDVCTVAECPVLTDSIDQQDYLLELEPVIGECCGVIRKTACKYNGKVYKVGEKWTPEGDYCTSLECTKNHLGIQKVTQISTCDTKCELGWEYVPATLEDKTCCGSCKPVACVVDEVIHKIGEQWFSPDFCINFLCAESSGSVQVQSILVTCPELPEDVINDYVVETTPVFGECCKEHRVVACKAESQRYEVGETWSPPDGDKCKKITCIQNMLGEIMKQETIETCNTNCSKGWEYKKSESKCCGECVQVACVVGDILKNPGESWKSPDGCTTYFCDILGDQFTVITQQESCPNVDDCPAENLYVAGCCKHCNITAEAQMKCAPEELKPLNTIGVIVAIKPPHGKCINTEAIPGFTRCVGGCPSSTTYNSVLGVHLSECSCCKPATFTPIVLNLECDDGYRFKKQISVPSKCECSGCDAKKQPVKGVKGG